MLIKPANMASLNVRAFFTTKHISKSDDDIKEVLAGEFNISRDDIYFPVQKHTGNIHVLESGREPVIADAVVTDARNIYIGIVVADCVPILLYDGQKGIIGAVHAGWRGTARQILKNTLETMYRHFHSYSGNISLAIGPSIRGFSYEVGEDVVSEVRRATGEGDYYSERQGKYFIDLASANKIQALSMGIPEDNIWQSEDCTYCNPHKYYSYRYSGGSTGRQCGIIGMW